MEGLAWAGTSSREALLKGHEGRLQKKHVVLWLLPVS